MPKDPDLTKHTLNLRAGDYAYISTLCESRSIPTALLIRRIISKFVDERKAKQVTPEIGDLNVDL